MPTKTNGAKLPPNHVLVEFGEGIPEYIRGPALLCLETYLRAGDIPAEVFLATMRDQNKLRRDLTREDVI